MGYLCLHNTITITTIILVCLVGSYGQTLCEMKSVMELVKGIIPRLNYGMHKGQAGRIAVLGGSFEYTGAPYYAATAGLKAGGDLTWVICTESAAVPIKSYSPEIIVVPALSKGHISQAEQLLSRIHALVIGPGLGRDPEVLDLATHLITIAREKNLPLVIDGDGLFLLAQNPGLISGYDRALLTPNVVEFERLYKNVLKKDEMDAIDFSGCLPDQTAAEDFGRLVPLTSPQAVHAVALAQALGHVTILQKGPCDIITNGKVAALSQAHGSPRRCGGQGDVLAGTTGLFVHWALTFASSDVVQDDHKFVVAAFGASALTRTASRLAFAKHQRSMTTPDLLNELDNAFRTCFAHQSTL